uniref:Uncharacterized protein n=1 Tax=Opuntia streptacantha TaxID=393608 RepID=A0A7C9APX2_OPUST
MLWARDNIVNDLNAQNSDDDFQSCRIELKAGNANEIDPLSPSKPGANINFSYLLTSISIISKLSSSKSTPQKCINDKLNCSKHNLDLLLHLYFPIVSPDFSRTAEGIDVSCWEPAIRVCSS